jgi:hypothetical protein
MQNRSSNQKQSAQARQSSDYAQFNQKNNSAHGQINYHKQHFIQNRFHRFLPVALSMESILQETVHLSIVAEKQQKCLRKTTEYTICGFYVIILGYLRGLLRKLRHCGQRLSGISIPIYSNKI